MAKEEKVVSFRLGGEALELAERELERRGISLSELAREAVVKHLKREGEDESTIHKMSMRLMSIETALGEVRKDIAVSTEALLINGGVSTTDAARWTDEKLRAA